MSLHKGAETDEAEAVDWHTKAADGKSRATDLLWMVSMIVD